MTTAERFVKNINKLRKFSANTDKNTAFKQIREHFNSNMKSIPANAADDLFYYFMKDSPSNYNTVDEILDKSHKLEMLINLFEGDLLEDEEPFTTAEWGYIRETVNEAAIDMEIEQIEFIMSIIVARGVF